jgi:peptidoglycan/xylan/chitin deacetylase (PgdA/CDA1 family)
MMNLTRRQFLTLSGATVLSLSLPWRATADVVRIPVLMYHDISVELKELETVMPSVFASQMEWLSAMGYRAISFEDLDTLDAKSVERAVIITFDDGYASFMDYAFPLLTEYRFKATVNIIGKEAERVLNSRQPMLSWDECRYLLQSGLVDIGCHTYGLHVWGGWSSPTTAITPFNERLKKDLATFQEKYSKELGRPAHILAWPYGMHDKRSIEIAQGEGFRYILTTHRGYLEKNGDRFAIHRQSVNHDVHLASFRAYITGRT